MSEQGGGAVTAGMLLRQAREAAGLHVAALAVSLKVPVRKLEALENDRLDLLPDAVFVRALASSMCRTLKIDPQPVLDLLPRTERPRLVQDRDGINAPFRAPSDATGPSWFDQLPKPVVLAVGALLVGALVVAFLPVSQRDEGTAAVKADGVPVPVVIPAEQAQPSVAAVPASTTLAIAPARSAPSVTPTDSTPNVLSPTAVVTPSAAIAKAAASAPATGPVSGTVVFRTTGPSWIKVTDAKGVVTLQRLLEAGESAGASGTPPLAVTIGSASTTQVQVRGQAFDLSKVPVVDNVARFEVK
jgi:cytoskeleton protein RodZ